MTDSGSSQPPGWYYAQGDPPGTQRYWDGAQWQGGPQAVADGAPGYGTPFAGGAGGQGSHVLSALATADALAVIPEADDSLPSGADVDLWWLDRA